MTIHISLGEVGLMGVTPHSKLDRIGSTLPEQNWEEELRGALNRSAWSISVVPNPALCSGIFCLKRNSNTVGGA